jgi:hypothetical protein
MKLAEDRIYCQAAIGFVEPSYASRELMHRSF